MKLVVNVFDPQEAQNAREVLEKAGIPHELRVHDESGADEIQISVPEDQFERAAEVIEKLYEEYAAAHKARSPQLKCPGCGGDEFAYQVERGKLGDYIVRKCVKCAKVIVNPEDQRRR